MRIISLTLMCTVAGLLNVGAQSAEHEAIKTMLHAETAAFYARDADAWQAKWLHDANATSALIGNNRYNYMKGWEDIAQRVARSIKANPKPMLVEIANTNFIIRQEGDLAWVEYDSAVGETRKQRSARMSTAFLSKPAASGELSRRFHIRSITSAPALKRSRGTSIQQDISYLRPANRRMPSKYCASTSSSFQRPGMRTTVWVKPMLRQD